MRGVHNVAIRELALLLVAAQIVDPLGSGLTEPELRLAAIERGMSAAVFDEIIREFWETRATRESEQAIAASGLDLMMLAARGHSFPSVFPMATFPRLDAAFTRLEERFGVHSPKSLEAILSECSDPPHKIKLALAILTTHRHVERVGDGFCRRLSISANLGTADPAHPDSKTLEDAMTVVESILARRSETAHPAEKPIERFHRFLKKQGWEGMAESWAAMAREVAGLWEHYPTAATVLAGAMLEMALVAIAEPAQRAGEWNQKFLNEDPRSWQLRDLIKQAEVAQTFSANEAAHARTLADVRNRIHAGRFAVGGTDRFRPPSTNAHEAQIAKLHLELLLTQILGWKPLSELL